MTKEETIQVCDLYAQGMNKIIEKINKILSVYEKDESICGGYSMTEYAIDSAPEDYNELRTDWETLRSRADEMYYMLNEIKSIVEEVKELYERRTSITRVEFRKTY